MYRVGSTSTMGSLRKDYVARIPIDLNCSPLSSSTITVAPTGAGAAGAAKYPSARIVINKPGFANGVSVIRCRIDSESTPPSSADHDDDDDYKDLHEQTHVIGKQPEVNQPVYDDIRKRSGPSSTSSEGRETGSILKKTEFSSTGASNGSTGGGSQSASGGGGGDRGKRTPQGRRRVRFTNNVAMYRFDSDGMDSAHSSSECERLYPPPTALRKPTANRYDSSPVLLTGNSLSKVKVNMTDDYEAVSGPRSAAEERRSTWSPSPPPQPTTMGNQQGRSPQVYHSTPNGSLYLRNNFDKSRSTSSVHWIGRNTLPSSSSSSSSPQKLLQMVPSSSLKSTNYALVSDPITHEKRLIITAKLSEVFQPNDITIKANKNGSKIRVVSSKAVHHQASTHGQNARTQINEQIVLPVQVDPYKLTARLDPNGSLLIEAPCTA